MDDSMTEDLWVFLSLFLPVAHFNLGKYFSPPEKPEIPPQLKKGSMYLVKGRDVARSYDLFARTVREGARGLLITRNYLRFTQALHQNVEGSQPAPGASARVMAHWLSQKEDENVLIPTHLHRMVYLISEALSKHNGLIILLDGIEYLIVHNRFDQVLKQLYIIREVLSRHEGILLISLDPDAFSEKEMGLLEKESIPI